jgi:hypothetical protein
MSIITAKRTYSDGTVGEKIFSEDATGARADAVTIVGKDGVAQDASNPATVTFPAVYFDAFGRLRSSNPFTLFDSKQLFDNQPLYWDDQEVSGSGTTSTHSPLTASSTMGVAANTAGKRVRQTFQRFNYQPGKSQLFLLTGVPALTGGGAGIVSCAGAFDDDNGVFAQSNEGVFEFVIRSNTSGTPVDNAVAQGSWNGDNMDGTGASGITLDGSKTQIMWYDMEWLGVGTIRCGFVIDGAFILCHSFHHANSLSVVYMSTPNLPLRYEISNDGTGVASEMMHICGSVMSEGGVQANGQLHYHSTGGAHVDADIANTVYAVVGIKLKTTHVGEQIDLTSISMINETDDNFEWIIYFNPTIAGTFTYADHANSAVQLATGATANTVTGGHEMAGGFVASAKGGGDIGVQLDNALRLGSAIDGTVDAIVLCVRPLSANADIDGGLGWRELT